ncbi:1-aminocyclopropane-1-carboxylate deaminase/D-cysteine desulfhydrase [Streptomyces boninensis]|uniref:1-aminocyclopropane-1-carboxylate deaminase/D-cysteine desulfhydrase n=1 Tax=Streptomyces boninensis TaxID=2039455 RepID=UPI003B20FD4B
MSRDPLDLDALAPRLPSPVQQADDPRFTARGLTLLLKREDLIHPELPGNKWRKLVPNLRAAAAAGAQALLTFGGAYSNHLRATAAAGRLLGFTTIGVVRGAELADRPLNPVLAGCAADGMRLEFVTRAAYRDKSALLPGLAARFGDFYAVPEGGSNAAAVRGCYELGAELAAQGADVAAVACGTGGTLAGLAAGFSGESVGFAVLKGGFLAAEVADLQKAAFGAARGRWRVEDGFHAGGYARTTPELDAFAADFEQRHGLAVERVYVAKMLWGLTTLAASGTFRPGGRLAAVITATNPPTHPLQ